MSMMILLVRQPTHGSKSQAVLIGNRLINVAPDTARYRPRRGGNAIYMACFQAMFIDDFIIFAL